MEEMNINFVAILITVVANFFLGFLWYTPLFGKAWAKENGFDLTVKPAGGDIAKGMIIMVIGNLFMAYVFASNMAAWNYVPGMEKAGVAGNIFMAAFFTWLGFYVPVDLSAVAWEKKSWKLFFINTGYHFTMLLVASVILTLMGNGSRA
jgi:hypothetical protein